MTKFKGSREELDSVLEEDRLMSAEEALSLGLIDEIITEVEPEKEETEPENKTQLTLLGGFELAKDHVKEEHEKLEGSFLAKFAKIE